VSQLLSFWTDENQVWIHVVTYLKAIFHLLHTGTDRNQIILGTRFWTLIWMHPSLTRSFYFDTRASVQTSIRDKSFRKFRWNAQ